MKIVCELTHRHLQAPEWHKMTVPKNAADPDLKIKIACRMDKPQNLKHCGYGAYIYYDFILYI